MKNIRFKEILFLSYKEKKAKGINLDSDVVVIKGGNGTGKSFLGAALVHTLSILSLTLSRLAPQNSSSLPRWAAKSRIYSMSFTLLPL